MFATGYRLKPRSLIRSDGPGLSVGWAERERCPSSSVAIDIWLLMPLSNRFADFDYDYDYDYDNDNDNGRPGSPDLT